MPSGKGFPNPYKKPKPKKASTSNPKGTARRGRIGVPANRKTKKK